MQSIEQHYYRETEEHNYNGCKLLVKKDAMLDSLDGKATITVRMVLISRSKKVNLMFVFIVVV